MTSDEEEDRPSYAERRNADWAEAMHREDEVSMEPIDPEHHGEVFFTVTAVYRWSEVASSEGLMEAIDMVKADPLGCAIDAHLEPRYETDVSEVLAFTHVVKYDDD